MPDDDELSLDWPMPNKRDVYPNFAKPVEDGMTRIQLDVDEIWVDYAGCGTHKLHITMDLEKIELERAITKWKVENAEA